MRPGGCEGELLGRLAWTPLLDRLEMVCVSGWSRAAVYEAVRRLEEGGFAASIPHAAELTPPTRRYFLTPGGLRRLAEHEDISLDKLLRSRPVSAQWRRILMERLDALAVVYRLASNVANAAARPVRLRLYRAGPLDAAVMLPGGRTVGIVRQGLTADRSAFSKRLWRLGEGPLPGAVLVLTSDEVRLRHSRRVLARTSAPAILALERDAVLAGADDPVWRPTSGNAALDLRRELRRMRPGGELPWERPLARATVPGDFAPDADHALPAILKPAEKRALDLLADWPWILQRDVAGLMGLSETRASRLTNPLEAFGLVTRAAGGRLALTDRGLAMLARRDRASVGVARKRWSVAPIDPEGPYDWRNVSGRQEQAAAQEHRAHRRRPRLHGRAGPPVPGPGMGDDAARPAPPGLAALPPRRHPALRQPRRLRRPAARPRDLALLPGMGAARRAALNHVRAPRPLPALLLVAPAHRRPRDAARRPGRLRRRHRRHPLPGSGPEGDGANRRDGPPVGLPRRGNRRPGAAGTRLANPRRLGAGPPAPGQMNRD